MISLKVWPNNLLDGSEMGRLIHDFDWANTGLGPIESWDSNLQSVVSLTIASEFPMFVFVGSELIQVYNDAAIDFVGGKHQARGLGIPWREAWYELVDLLSDLITVVVETGRSLKVESALLPIDRHGFLEECYVTFSYVPIRDRRGAVCAIHCIVQETTARIISQRRGATLLEIAHATEGLSLEDACLSIAAVLGRATRDVPFAAFYRFDGSSAERIATSGIDREFRGVPPSLSFENVERRLWPIAAVARGETAEIAYPFEEALVMPPGPWPELPSKALLVPIFAGETQVAGFALFGVSSRLELDRGYRAYFSRIAEEFALTSRNTAARESARLENLQQRRVADIFQEAAMPKRLPDVPGMRFDAIYLPGSAEAMVGGDWYDAMRLDDGRVVVAIGDVAGHGLEAAVKMGNVRQIVRGIAQVHADPSLMLNAADRALAIEYPDTYVTAFVGVVDLVERTLVYASAGHPSPLLRSANGDVVALASRGLPLGLRAGFRSTSETVSLTAGSLLVMYTDGLTEARRDAIEDERRLAQVIAELGPRAGVANRLKNAVLAGFPSPDDVAVLAVHVESFAPDLTGFGYHSWSFESSDASAAREARHAFAALVAGAGSRPANVAAAEAVFGELVANVVLHAGGLVEVTLDLSDRRPVLHVLDRATRSASIGGFHGDTLPESGRGLTIAMSLALDLAISPRYGGGNHARAVLAT